MKYEILFLTRDLATSGKLTGKEVTVFFGKYFCKTKSGALMIFESNESFTISMTADGVKGKPIQEINDSNSVMALSPIVVSNLFGKKLKDFFSVLFRGHENIINCLKQFQPDYEIAVITVFKGKYDVRKQTVRDYIKTFN